MEKILVIDDEAEATDLLMDFLSSRGYTVVTASDGEEGLKKFDTENPDIGWTVSSFLRNYGRIKDGCR
jgi:two-component system, OmpR family, alkaline phosphatase synthesis response regulator PhoP